ncbi:MAG: polysaccharide pyruvyl transferase family protein [Phycisphaerales bacterium]|nr:MAG: polysaccharide pyruvyl transferase family protein [Phycisphaerales bacterium]
MHERPALLLTGNGSHFSRGCEAIFRGTVRILRRAFDSPKFVNANLDMSRRPYVPAHADRDVVHRPIIMKRWSPQWVLRQVFRRVLGGAPARLMFRPIRGDILECDAVLSVGGDNYSLDYGIPYDFVAMGEYVSSLKRPLIVWGASVGPFDSHPRFARRMHEHLKRCVSGFFVREELSRDYLISHGIADDVVVMGDPAFVMEGESVSEDRIGFALGSEAVGLTLSPLMARWVTGGEMRAWLDRSVGIVRCLRRQCEGPVILIPHDTRERTDDHAFMSAVLRRLGHDSKDVFLLPADFDAAETKWVISKMRCLVAARTHATIAAFSSCVPTVSLGYSVKAEGINRQLFGHTGYLIRGKDINERTVMETTRKVLSSENEIRGLLRDVIPGVQKQAFDAGVILREMLERL